MKRAPFAAILLSSALLLCCSNEVVVSYDMQTPFERELYSQGDYSTLNAVGEVVGTGMRWWLTESYLPQGEGGVLARRYSGQKNMGYHRHSRPSELALKVPIRADVDARAMGAVRGYENFVADVVEGLPVHSGFKTPLRDPALVDRFVAEERLRWKAAHLLSGRVPRVGDITGALRASLGEDLGLAPLRVDSVVARDYADLEIEGRKCFHYSIHYRLDDAPDADLLFEQFTKADTSDGRKFADFKASGASAKGDWRIWISPSTGRLCREQDWQEITVVAAHRETGEALPVVARKAVERLYTYDVEKQTKKHHKDALINQ